MAGSSDIPRPASGLASPPVPAGREGIPALHPRQQRQREPWQGFRAGYIPPAGTGGGASRKGLVNVRIAKIMH